MQIWLEESNQRIFPDPTSHARGKAPEPARETGRSTRTRPSVRRRPGTHQVRGDHVHPRSCSRSRDRPALGKELGQVSRDPASRSRRSTATTLVMDAIVATWARTRASASARFEANYQRGSGIEPDGLRDGHDRRGLSSATSNARGHASLYNQLENAVQDAGPGAWQFEGKSNKVRSRATRASRWTASTSRSTSTKAQARRPAVKSLLRSHELPAGRDRVLHARARPCWARWSTCARERLSRGPAGARSHVKKIVARRSRPTPIGSTRCCSATPERHRSAPRPSREFYIRAIADRRARHQHGPAGHHREAPSSRPRAASRTTIYKITPQSKSQRSRPRPDRQLPLQARERQPAREGHAREADALRQDQSPGEVGKDQLELRGRPDHPHQARHRAGCGGPGLARPRRSAAHCRTVRGAPGGRRPAGQSVTQAPGALSVGPALAPASWIVSRQDAAAGKLERWIPAGAPRTRARRVVRTR